MKKVNTIQDIKVGDIVTFACNGRGRGGHYSVKAKVTKINRTTFEATEAMMKRLFSRRGLVRKVVVEKHK